MITEKYHRPKFRLAQFRSKDREFFKMGDHNRADDFMEIKKCKCPILGSRLQTPAVIKSKVVFTPKHNFSDQIVNVFFACILVLRSTELGELSFRF